MGAARLGERLLRWLLGLAAGAGEPDLPQPLPAIPDVDWVRAAAAGDDPGANAAEVALVLLAIARDGDEAVRLAAVDALGAAEPRWWIALDEALRQRWWWVPRWARITAAALADADDLDLLRLALAGCHPDGHLREAAVAHLAGQDHPAAVALVAVRTCDWVRQVRDGARTVATSWFSPPADGSVLVTATPMALALRNRREGRWLAEQVERALYEAELAALEPLLSARDRKTRRAAYHAGIATGRLSLDRLTMAAAKEPDVPIRVMCARAAIATSTDPTRVRQLLTSRTALVRAEALYVMAATAPEVTLAALTDRHRLVRAVAQDAVRRGGGDPAHRYRDLIVQAPPVPAVIAGLGETGGGTDDAGLIRPWLSHPRARGRVEAIRALRRWGAIQSADLVTLLRDDSAAVVRQTVRVRLV